jgi:hypothetical protein
LKKPEEVIKEGAEERRLAFETSGAASAAKRVVHFLFPGVASADGGFSLGRGTYVEGNISHPAKLAIALQLSVTDGDVSIKAARQYLQDPTRRESVVAGLTSENCDEFISLLGEVGESLRGEGITDLDEICVSIARLVERPLFIARAKSNRRAFRLQIEDMALHAVSLLARATDKERIPAISKLIAIDSLALSCAAEVVSRNYVPGRDRYPDGIELLEEDKGKVLQAFSENVLEAANLDKLLKMNQAGFILWTMARVAPKECPKLFNILKASDSTLDQFALYFLGGNWDSTKGDSYSLPRDTSLHEVYCPLADFKSHAIARLQDENLQYPERAAWRSVIEGNCLYGIDGTEARHRD